MSRMPQPPWKAPISDAARFLVLSLKKDDMGPQPHAKQTSALADRYAHTNGAIWV